MAGVAAAKARLRLKHVVLAWASLCAQALVEVRGLDKQAFVERFWQREPLLVRGLLDADALRDVCHLTPRDLLDLAADDDALARLVTRTHDAARPWMLERGPFEPSRLVALPHSDDWTVLVSDVDKLVPSVERLRDSFDFVPRWQIDDVMVSFAPAGASIGAHVDSYDVFLLQGRGTRRWAIETAPRTADEEPLLAGADVRVLTDFCEDVTCVLEPGDALYLPPRLAHHGVSNHAQCMTYSIGFRAPSVAELLESFGASVAQAEPSDRMLGVAVADGAASVRRGRIDPGVVSAARDEVARAYEAAMRDDEGFARWCGRLLTAPSPRRIAQSPPLEAWDYTPERRDGMRELVESIASGEGDEHDAVLRPAEDAMLAYMELGGGGCALFVNGEHIELGRYGDEAMHAHIPLLCDSLLLSGDVLHAPLKESPGLRELVAELLRRDVLFVE